ncbi:MAG: T9SS type B sorting domain-containing protein, partial [Saprospiraceae bacterium]
RIVAVPTGFTPNGDGANDRLLVHGQEGTTIRTFRIYDRWGELLYEARDFEVNDDNFGWDGSFIGKMMNGGVYLWYVDAEYADGVREVFKGQTTLIR